MEDSELAWLTKFANALESMSKSESAEVLYEVLSDALYWSDEIPDVVFDSEEGPECVKALLRYRTGLILGNPPPELFDIWSAALRLFPHWPGFDENRFRQDPHLQSLHAAHHARALDAIRNLPD